MAKKRAKKTSIGFLLWIALILLLIVIILFNKNTITNFISQFKYGQKTEVTTKNEKKEPTISFANITNKIKNKNNTSEIISKTNKTETEQPKIQEKEKEIIAETIKVAKETIVETIKKEKEIVTEKNTELKKRTYTIYFINPTNEDPLKIHGIERIISFEDSPLQATLSKLIDGIQASEFNSLPNITNCIPKESQIQNISIKNGVATISLNSAFTINSYSREGLEASLKQIVYTATEFNSINSVQFLINGKKQPYLGAEGGYIGSPLQRNSFQ